MSTDIVLYEKEDQIATVTLNQPATLNALTYDVVLTGAGRGSCSGANLMGGTGEALEAGGMGVRAAVMAMNEVLAGIAEMQKRGLQAAFAIRSTGKP